MSSQNVVFVGGVKACFTQQEIGNYFSQFGEIISIKMKKSRKKKNMNRGFCLIKFEKAKSARRVIEVKNHTLMGRLVTCREYLKGEKLKEGKKNKNDKKIYINGLPGNASNIDIIKAFSVFGEVESGYTLKEQFTGLSKGFGFVTFEKKESVDIALNSTLRVTIFNNKIEVAPFACGGQKAGEIEPVNQGSSMDFLNFNQGNSNPSLSKSLELLPSKNPGVRPQHPEHSGQFNNFPIHSPKPS